MMELRFTNHARKRMEEHNLFEADVVAVISTPERVITGTTAIEYDARIRGKPVRVVVVKESDPLLVITVHEVYTPEGPGDAD